MSQTRGPQTFGCWAKFAISSGSTGWNILCWEKILPIPQHYLIIQPIHRLTWHC